MGGHGRGNTLGHTCRMDCVVAGVFTVSGAPKGMKWDNEGWFAITPNFVISPLRFAPVEMTNHCSVLTMKPVEMPSTHWPTLTSFFSLMSADELPIIMRTLSCSTFH